jgi:hypothetical protein
MICPGCSFITHFEGLSSNCSSGGFHISSEPLSCQTHRRQISCKCEEALLYAPFQFVFIKIIVTSTSRKEMYMRTGHSVHVTWASILRHVDFAVRMSVTVDTVIIITSVHAVSFLVTWWVSEKVVELPPPPFWFLTSKFHLTFYFELYPEYSLLCYTCWMRICHNSLIFF